MLNPLLLLTSFLLIEKVFCFNHGLSSTSSFHHPCRLLLKDTRQQNKQEHILPTTQLPLSLTLFASKKDDNITPKKAREKGVYVRPSGAIEQGSGFYIPGLEGSRVRFAFGGVLLLLLVLNHIFSVIPTSGNVGLLWEEQFSLVYILIVVFQAAIELGKEEFGIGDDTSAASSPVPQLDTVVAKGIKDEQLTQKWASSSTKEEDDWKSRVQWCAASYVAMTPATQMMLLEPNQVVYRLGGKVSKDDKNEKIGTVAALEALSKSTSGRISLPITHPASEALLEQPQSENDQIRTVVLQRISSDQCWMMTSDQLIASFTSQDLKWLGQMALYVQ